MPPFPRRHRAFPSSSAVRCRVLAAALSSTAGSSSARPPRARTAAGAPSALAVAAGRRLDPQPPRISDLRAQGERLHVTPGARRRCRSQPTPPRPLSSPSVSRSKMIGRGGKSSLMRKRPSRTTGEEAGVTEDHERAEPSTTTSASPASRPTVRGLALSSLPGLRPAPRSRSRDRLRRPPRGRPSAHGGLERGGRLSRRLVHQPHGRHARGTYNRIARWDGSRWHRMGDGVDSTVLAIVLNGEDVDVGGEFRVADGTVAAAGSRGGTGRPGRRSPAG